MKDMHFSALVLLPLLFAVLSAIAAPRGKTDGRAVRVADVPPAVKSEMARLPMVVYLPGIRSEDDGTR